MNDPGTDTRARREALAGELVDLLDLGRSSRRMFANDDAPAELRESEERSHTISAHVRGLRDQTPDIIRIYADYWTAAELVDLLAFYRSDLGTRFRAFLPIFATEIGKATASVYDANASSIKELMMRITRPPNAPSE